jgi:hypothetical protein
VAAADSSGRRKHHSGAVSGYRPSVQEAAIGSHSTGAASAAWREPPLLPRAPRHGTRLTEGSARVAGRMSSAPAGSVARRPQRHVPASEARADQLRRGPAVALPPPHWRGALAGLPLRGGGRGPGLGGPGAQRLRDLRLGPGALAPPLQSTAQAALATGDHRRAAVAAGAGAQVAAHRGGVDAEVVGDHGGRLSGVGQAPGGVDPLGQRELEDQRAGRKAGGLERLAEAAEVVTQRVRRRPARPLALPPGRPLVVEPERARRAGRPLVGARRLAPSPPSSRPGRRGSARRSSAAWAVTASTGRMPPAGRGWPAGGWAREPNIAGRTPARRPLGGVEWWAPRSEIGAENGRNPPVIRPYRQHRPGTADPVQSRLASGIVRPRRSSQGLHGKEGLVIVGTWNLENLFRPGEQRRAQRRAGL